MYGRRSSRKGKTCVADTRKNVSEILTPALAWAFFGPDEELARLVNDFKEQVRSKAVFSHCSETMTKKLLVVEPKQEY